MSNPRAIHRHFPLWLASVLAIAPGVPLAADEGGGRRNSLELEALTHLSLEELGAVKVTSVSKKAEILNEVPAAVSVITADDIRRSGALTLPEALRLAPGVQVARVDSALSAVSVRGFNDTFSQKLLVLMDGRSIYTPLFSGTLWHAQDTMLEDLDRIEVIRGPGGSVWGANAVNGVINIVSKPARETQGVLLSGGGGSDHLGLTGARYGMQLGTNTFVRFYGKYDDWDTSHLVGGGEARDAWWKGQGGFRLDWEPSTADRLTLQGDLSGLRADQLSPRLIFPSFGVPPPAGGYNSAVASHWNQTGGNALGRWTHQFSEESDLSVQTYYDRQRIKMALLEETRDTVDLDLRHRLMVGERNEIVSGGGYRLSDTEASGSAQVSLSRATRSDQTVNFFVQDEIKLVPDRLRLTLGSKIEHNDYTGFELEPGTRLSWTPTSKQTVWAAVARAVRTPSQFERDATVHLAVVPPNPMNPLPTLVSVSGSSELQSETLIAYELGYRIQVHPKLTLDSAVFLNEYDELRSTESTVDLGNVPNYVHSLSTFNNRAGGRTYGGELAATFQASDWWRLHAQFSTIQADLHQPANNMTGSAADPDFSTPEFQSSLRSSMDLGKHFELDAWLRYAAGLRSATAAVPGLNTIDELIPSYITFDLRLAWHPTTNLELSVVGQNLAGTHREFNPTFISTQATDVGPSVYGKLTWRF